MAVEPRLPLAPLRRYVEAVKDQYAEDMGLDPRRVIEHIAPMMGLSPRRLHYYLNDSETSASDTVSFSTVDTVMKTDARDVYGLESVDLDAYRKEPFFCSKCGIELRTKADLCGFCIDEERMAA